jgi:hypothetical protein
VTSPCLGLLKCALQYSSVCLKSRKLGVAEAVVTRGG